MTKRHWLLGGGLTALGYAAGIEPYRVEATHWEMRCPRLPKEFDGYTVLQISDLHMRQIGRRERIIRRLLEEMGPVDVIAVTGDMVHTQAGIAPFLELAKAFQSRDGAFVVYGNSEHKNGVRPHAFAQQLAQNGLTPLLNKHAILTRGGAQIAVAGVDDPHTGKDKLADALAGLDEEIFTLLLMHSPDSIAEAVVRGADVVLSGHTHGGQVSLPGFGPPVTHVQLGRRMSSGYYAGRDLRRCIGIRPGRTQLYVSRGLGVSGLALRFLVRPELSLFTLRRGTPSLSRLL